MTDPQTYSPLTDEAISVDDRAALAAMLIDAYLAGVARGREEYAAEQNSTYPPAPIRHLGQWVNQADERRAWDASARKPRPTDHPGGAIRVW